MKMIKYESRVVKDTYDVSNTQFSQSKSQINPGADMDSFAFKQAQKERQVQDPILNGINSYIETMRQALIQEGEKAYNMIENVYKQYFETQCDKNADERSKKS